MNNSVYWIGQDNNIWLKGPNGTHNAGPAANANPQANGYTDPWADSREKASFMSVNQINDPMVGRTLGANTYAGNSSGLTGNSSGLTGDERAYLDNSENTLRGYMNDLNTGLDQGRTTLNDSYNRELGDANENRGRTVRNFETQGQGIERNRDRGTAEVDTNARTLSNSVRRILGMASGSGSSAYQIAAPDAINRKASGERTNVMENFDQNFMALDTAKKDSGDDFTRYLRDLNIQRNDRSAALETGIESQRTSLYNQLAEVQGKRDQGGGYAAIRAGQAPYLQAGQASKQAAQGIFDKYRTPQNSVRAVDVKTPSLRDYTVNRASINANRSDGKSRYSPYLLPQGKKDEELA